MAMRDLRADSSYCLIGRAGSLTDDTLAGPLWLRPVVAAASPALYREWADWLRNPAA